MADRKDTITEYGPAPTDYDPGSGKLADIHRPPETRRILYDPATGVNILEEDCDD